MTTTNTFNLRRVRGVLAFDAVTCFAAGSLMALAAYPLGALTALNPVLLQWAGLALFPVAALFFYMSRATTLGRGLIQFAVIGNLLWVAGCLAVLAYGGGNLLGHFFVAGQALAVAVLAVLEARDGFGPAARAAG